ncbi:MAG: hypothetical protein IT366_07015 [Candidatus Hydrogenedentes bacterium]|nr:hypothetical protein [Candidatus Hydrogenedentota bacterium]
MTQIESENFMCTTKAMLTALLLLACAAPSYGELGWGKPAYIVVGKDAPQQERFAASEFQRLYELRTGKKLPVFNKEAGENGVFIGRSALNSERDERKGTLPDGTQYTSGTPIKWEPQLEKDLDIDLDRVSPDFILYSLTGWTGTFAAFILGGSPDSTVNAVYDFCEINLGIKRDADTVAASTLKPFTGWSNHNFTQKPESEFWPNKPAQSVTRSVTEASKEQTN